jgi:hypothetical protein
MLFKPKGAARKGAILACAMGRLQGGGGDPEANSPRAPSVSGREAGGLGPADSNDQCGVLT